jgi:hypothetical protein
MNKGYLASFKRLPIRKGINGRKIIMSTSLPMDKMPSINGDGLSHQTNVLLLSRDFQFIGIGQIHLKLAQYSIITKSFISTRPRGSSSKFAKFSIKNVLLKNVDFKYINLLEDFALASRMGPFRVAYILDAIAILMPLIIPMISVCFRETNTNWSDQKEAQNRNGMDRMSLAVAFC